MKPHQLLLFFSGLLLLFCCLMIPPRYHHNPTTTLPTTYAAVLVSTNILSHPCPCGFCKDGVVIPEHINQIGYDLYISITTNYLPIVELPN